MQYTIKPVILNPVVEGRDSRGIGIHKGGERILRHAIIPGERIPEGVSEKRMPWLT